MTDIRFRITADGAPATTEVERVKRSLNTLPAAARGAQSGMDGMTMSAAQMTQAMRQVPMQITDIVTSLASGMPVHMVAIQQGGQLKDSFGGVVPAAKALATTVAGMINPLTLTAAAAGAVAVAWHQGSQEAREYQKALVLSGNAIGMTVDGLSTLARDLGKTVGTQGQAAEALAQMAGSSHIAARDLGRLTEAAIVLERTTGQSIGETRKQFEALARGPFDALVRLNEGTNFLTAAVLEQVWALEQQGDKTEAARVAQEAWASATIERGEEVVENLGWLEKGWNAVRGAAASAWDVMKGIGRDPTLTEQLAKIDAQIRAFEETADRRRTAGRGVPPAAEAELERLKAERAGILELQRTAEEANAAKAAAAQREAKQIAELAEAKRKSEKEAQEHEREAKRRGQEAQRRADQELEALRRRDEQMTALIDRSNERDATRLQEEMLAGAAAALRTWEAEAAAREASAVAAERQALAFGDTISAIQFEAQVLQMAAEQRELATEMRKLEALGLEKNTEAWHAYAAAIKGAIGDRAAVRAGIESARAYEAEWKRVNDQIGQSLTDALMRGGKSGAEYLRGVLRSALAQPIQVMLQPITGTIANVLTGGSSPGGSSSAGMLGSLGSFGTSFSKALTAESGLFSTVGEGFALMKGGSLASGAGTALGAVAPYIAAAAALYSLLGQGGERRAGSTYGYSASDLSYGAGMRGIWSDEVAGSIAAGQTRFIGGPSGGELGGDAVRQSVEATVAGINQLFDRLGSTDKIDQFWGKLEQSERGRGGVFAGGTLASGAAFGEASWEAGTSRTLNADEAIQAFALDLQQATVQALQAATDIPESVADVVRGIDAEALTAEQVGALLQTVDAIMTAVEAMRVLGVGVDQVSTAMIAAAGGMDALTTAAASYYQGYYTEAERVGHLSEQLASQFEALSLQMPATRAEFRELVESLDLTTTQGQAAYGSLLSLSEAFGVVADATAEAVGTIIDAARTPAETVDEALARLRGVTRTSEDVALNILALEAELFREANADDIAALRKRELAGLAAAEAELLTQIWATQDARAEEVAAAQRAAQAAQQAQADIAAAAAAMQRVAQERYQLETQLLTAQGDTAALRARELELLDPSNRALQEQVWALQDQAAAAQRASQAASQARAAWERLTDSIIDEVQRIRGVVAEDAGMGYAQSAAAFATARAQASAGDRAAMEALPGLARTMLELAEANAGTLLELQRIRAQTAGSLAALVGLGGSTNAAATAERVRRSLPQLDTGTNYVPRDMMAVVHEGEAVVPKAYNPAAGNRDQRELLAEIRALNARLARLEGHAAATTKHTERTARVLDDAQRGRAPLVTETAP